MQKGLLLLLLRLANNHLASVSVSITSTGPRCGLLLQKSIHGVVFVSVCILVTTMSAAKMTELIETLEFWLGLAQGAVYMGATWQIWLNYLCTVAMQAVAAINCSNLLVYISALRCVCVDSLSLLVMSLSHVKKRSRSSRIHSCKRMSTYSCLSSSIWWNIYLETLLFVFWEKWQKWQIISLFSLLLFIDYYVNESIIHIKKTLQLVLLVVWYLSWRAGIKESSGRKDETRSLVVLSALCFLQWFYAGDRKCIPREWRMCFQTMAYLKF